MARRGFLSFNRAVFEPRRPAGGFTLIELMVTVAVVAIFASLAAPSFRQLIAKQRLRSAASALTESLWLARSEATKRNTASTVGFSFSNVANGWSVQDLGASPVVTLSTQDPLPAVSSGAGNFQFNAYGRMTGAGTVQIGVASLGIYRCVSVSTTGRATSTDGACP